MSPSRCSPYAAPLTLALAAALLVPVGASAAGKLAFAPAALDFGFNALGEAKTLTSTLKNGTATDIALVTTTLVDNPGGYAIVSTTCGATLAAGQTCKYTLKYTAKTLPAAAARLELTTLDPAFPLLKLPLQANLYPALNDTGIARCSNGNKPGLTCPVPNFPEQDAQYGRDKTRNVASNGKAGFYYTKLDSKGKALPAKATSWNCVRDNVTGLVWEKKPKGDGTMGNQGLHDADDYYTWYSTDIGNNGGGVGTANPGKKCFGYKVGQAGTFCNTEAYVNRVNAAGWCGYTDWRLPDLFELRGLLDLSNPLPGPKIDKDYFPDLEGELYHQDDYWVSSPYAPSSNASWFVEFNDGISEGRDRSYSLQVRLVCGGK